MAVRLQRIVFDHIPGAASNDALSIRRNRATAAASDVVAYALEPTRNQPLTILAEFAVDLPAGTALAIRAIPADGTVSALGTVGARTIEVPQGGRTGPLPFQLVGATIWDAGVAVHMVSWSWQSRTGGGAWTEFQTTTHRVYVTLDMPDAPWDQPPENSPVWPWTDVLDWSCRWAAGAKSEREVAGAIVRGVWELGERAVRPVKYSEAAFYVSSLFDVFRCTSFLKLLNGERRRYPFMNCSDCATAVVTFANILGCRLALVSLDPNDKATFRLNPVRVIGSPPSPEAADEDERPPEAFGYHEIAWHPPGRVEVFDGDVFDATLQVDADPRPHAPPFQWELATGTRFLGRHRPPLTLGYRDRLVARGDRAACIPSEQPYRRLDSAAGKPPSAAGARARLREAYLRILSQTPIPPSVVRQLDLSRPPQFEGFALYETSQPSEFFADFEDLIVMSVEWLYEALADPEIQISVALALTRRAADAREVLAWNLTECMVEVQPLIVPDADRVGDLAFVAPRQRAIYFVRANTAARLVRVGQVPLAPIARRADQVLVDVLQELAEFT